ncbi:hypothetical protein [Sphingomonas sp. CFBP 8760]|uniref:hypothetical protein n=1 Tax=Sphingomonas sp. CFBP 8760 TaxID=2775282 RepID=UPI00177AC1D7|nr:hypothetical protein [Sphingomonas sp. CFBP 8760]MBD8548262.1 hypothetical protein [Sphingomonas sp. CFBP 8760]
MDDELPIPSEMTVDHAGSVEGRSVRHFEVSSPAAPSPFRLEIEVTGEAAEVRYPPDLPDMEAFEAALAPVPGADPEAAAPHADPLDQAEHRVTGALTSAGYRMRRVAAPLRRLEGKLDLRTGQFLARGLADDGTEVDPDLSRRLQRIVTSVFENRTPELVARIDEATAAGMHGAAASLLTDGIQEGLVVMKEALLAAALRIDLDQVDGDVIPIRRLRVAIATALQREPLAEADARTLLADEATTDERHALETFLGTVAMRQGRAESALVRWRRVLADDPKAIDRAWAWRNVALSPSVDLNKTVEAARASADAFLEAGEKNDAIGSLLIVCDTVAHQGVDVAAANLRSLVDIVDAPGLLGDADRGAILHLVAQRLFDFGLLADALVEADRAIRLRRGVHGLEDALVSILTLARLAAEGLERHDDAAAYRAEAAELGAASGSQVLVRAERVRRLLDDFDPVEARAIIDELAQDDDDELMLAARLATVLFDRSLSMDDRIEHLERLDQNADRTTSSRSRNLLSLAIADALEQQGYTDRARARLDDLLAEHPLELPAREALERLLQRHEEWAALISRVEERIALFGATRELLERLAVAALRDGKNELAIRTCWNALERDDLTGPQKVQFNELIRMAVSRGGDPGALVAASPPSQTSRHPILLEEVEQAIRDYAEFVACNRRSTFWRNEGGKRVWTSRPEEVAKALFQTYLSACFRGRAEVIEEMVAGGGRLDILMRFDGGLRVIVELKMCGRPYSSSYAAAGEQQLTHYMRMRGVETGFLVVHDGRTNMAGTPVLDGEAPTGRSTIKEIAVIVTPGTDGL